MPLTLVFVSGMVMDLFTITERMPDRGETLMASHMEQHPGGKGCNAGIAAYRYSRVNPDDPKSSKATQDDEDDEIKVRVAGAIGDDAYGQGCIEPLQASNIDVSGVRVLKGERTGVSTIIVEQDYGENRILQTSGANARLRPSDFETIDHLTGGIRPDLLTTQIELPRDTVEHILRLAHKQGIPTLLNPSPAAVVLPTVLKEVTHLVVNETEAALLAGLELHELDNADGWERATAEFLSGGVQNVVLTLGALGAYYSNAAGEKGHVPAIKVENVKDPTGAGDTFVGTYAVEYVRQKRNGKWDIKYAVERACKAAACVIQKVGCQPAIPWRNELEDDSHVAGVNVPDEEVKETVPDIEPPPIVVERVVGDGAIGDGPVGGDAVGGDEVGQEK